MFLRNNWYVAAWGSEVTSTPLARTLLGEPIVLYRQADGTVGALEDRCIHRNLPLSLGEVCGNRLVCAYHGLAYAADGRVVDIPCQDHIPGHAKIRSYPAIERDQAVWLWMGDPALADPAGITPYPFHNDAGWGWKPGYSHIAGNHELLNDNLIDLSHVGWVHRKTIGGTPEAHSRAEFKVLRDGDSVTVRRYMLDTVPPPTYVRAVGFNGRIDRWMQIRFVPGLVQVYAGANDAGSGVDEETMNDRFAGRIFNGITPETEDTTHYFWSAAHNFRVDQPDVTDAFHREVEATFMEDKAVMEAQYRRMRDTPGARMLDIRSDAGGIQARRVLAARIEAERRKA